MELEPRPGARPTTSLQGPHRQLDQQATPELWALLVDEVFALPHTVEGRSQVSPPSSRAVLFDDLHDVVDPATSLAPGPPLEPVHLHGVHDTSCHLCLPADRARQVCELGWGEPHGFADHDTEVMVYGPRDHRELEVVLGLVQESLDHARRRSVTAARVMSLGPGEPAATRWEAVDMTDLVAHLRRATGEPVGRPAVVAVDGRSGAGKSTLARRMAATVGAAVVVHTDDIAWNQSFFDWHGLLAEHVLEPVRANRPVAHRPTAWEEHGRSGTIEVPAGLDWVVVEGVGAVCRDLSHLVDAVVWVQSDAQEAERRGLERDVAEGTQADARRARAFWDEWMAQEIPFLERERPWDGACWTVAGTEVIDHTPDQIVVSHRRGDGSE